jgi:hypothetical protein
MLTSHVGQQKTRVQKNWAMELLALYESSDEEDGTPKKRRREPEDNVVSKKRKVPPTENTVTEQIAVVHTAPEPHLPDFFNGRSNRQPLVQQKRKRPRRNEGRTKEVKGRDEG